MTTRNVFIFIGTFITGALIALVVRAAMFKPVATEQSHSAVRAEYAPMVSNPLTPATQTGSPAANPSPSPVNKSADSQTHANHQAETTNASASPEPVNTVCAICGMKVDPKLETLEYRGKTIGFGCKLCAPKFNADPEKYGPAYLKNDVIKR